MSRYRWPVTMLEEHKIDQRILQFFQGYVQDSEEKSKKLEDLFAEHQLLKDTSSKQERYIAELEKQIGLLQKTLDLVDKNTQRYEPEFHYDEGYQPHGALQFSRACAVCVNQGSDLCRDCKNEVASGFKPPF